ncbi:MFS transporter [Leifsonia sp. LS1]|uniref:MFS transporter n=1 Tax=Leifsonia sp. LS1 TaxID=2828483 RepID=UPI001CFC7F43|nr:MFS transporter [Leifsonia sp. LS1]GIT79277.1 MFS transporter [Leifsonia sp. LS1]
MTNDHATDTREESRNLRRTAVAGIIGSIVEYYDFTLYGLAAALVFGPLFFPGQDPATQVISSLLTFAVGYLGRPVGGLLFSHFGDRFGRKPMLVGTLILMGAATVAIGLLPTYGAIGVWAPILLGGCRVLQGMGAGAEYVGALVMMAESGDRRRYGLRVSLPGMGVFAGIVLATGVFAVIATLPEESLLTWGWRVPFLASVVTLAIGMWIRVGIRETEEFQRLATEKRTTRLPVWEAIRTQWREILIGFGLNGPYLAFSSLTQVYLLSYLTGPLGLPAGIGLTANLVSSALAIGTVPLFGWLGDRLGRGRVWLFGAGVFVLFGVAVFGLLATGDPIVITGVMVVGISLGLASMYAVQGAILTALFEPQHRLTGVVLVREPTAALVAGPAPAFAAWLVLAAGGATWPVGALYILSALVAAGSLFALRGRSAHAASAAVGAAS